MTETINDMRRKPTRRDLLVVIGRLQDIIGRAKGISWDDRDPDRQDHLQKTLEEGFELCVEVIAQDPPIEPSGPWSAP